MARLKSCPDTKHHSRDLIQSITAVTTGTPPATRTWFRDAGPNSRDYGTFGEANLDKNDGAPSICCRLGENYGVPMLWKNWTNPFGASAAKHISRPRADSSAAALPRGNMADSYCVSAVSTSSPCPAMANASSVASSMARLAPSPAYG